MMVGSLGVVVTYQHERLSKKATEARSSMLYAACVFSVSILI